MICRLCLRQDITEMEAINIFDEIGIELKVSVVLGKHFWFEPKCDDPISTALCNSCWLKVSDFHQFYLNVEESHRLLTERFSIKTEECKVLKQNPVNAPNNGSKNVDAEDEERKMELQFAELLEDDYKHFEERTKMYGTEEPRKILLPHADNSALNEACEDEDSIDGEMFMEDILANNENEDSDDNDVLATVKNEKESIENHQIRRSTRSFTKANVRKCKKIAKTSNIKTETQENESKDKVIPVKKRRGRPPGKNKSIDRTNINVSELKSPKKEKSRNHGSSTTDSNYESKMREVDEKISQHMRLVCDICAAELPTFAQLRQHIEKTHKCKGYAMCCNKKFYKRVLLVDHIEKHLNPECYKCDECNKVFSDKQCMRNHILIKHQPDEVKTFGCDHCPKKFAKPYLLDQHRVVHEARTHICNECNKGFPTAYLLTGHIKLIHMNYGTMCDICAKVIRGRAAFEKHQLEHSGIAQPKVQCDKCGSWHKDKYSLQKHKRRHNEEGTQHVCNLCNKVAPNRSALLSHQRYVHKAERSFECGVCKKAFKKAISLKEHMATHTGEVLYNCPHCTKTFNSNANMHSHRKKVHPKEFEAARKYRRENITTITADRTTSSTSFTAANNNNVKDDNDDDSLPQMITIKTTDDGQTHSILVTTTDYSDQDEGNNETVGEAEVLDANSIIFPVN